MLLQNLTKTEKKVIQKICAEGVITNEDLQLYFLTTEATIKTHLHHIFAKTDTKSKAELIYKFYNGGELEWQIFVK